MDIAGAWKKTKTDLIGKQVTTDAGTQVTIDSEETAEVMLSEAFDHHKKPGANHINPDSPEYSAMMLPIINEVRTKAGLEEIQFEEANL